METTTNETPGVAEGSGELATAEELKAEEAKVAKAAKLSEAALKGAETKRRKAKEANKEVPVKPEVILPEKAAAPAKLLKKSTEPSILRTVGGKTVPEEDYFYKGIIPSGFVGSCGESVDREDLITIFHKVFKEKDDILFYKQLDKEVYIVIIPIKYATTIGDFNDSIDGDFQKHAISFLNEGSVNLDTLRIKLERINKFVNYSDR